MLAICQRSQDGELTTSRNANNLRVQYRQVRLRRSDPRNAEWWVARDMSFLESEWFIELVFIDAITCSINRTRNRTLRLTVVIVLTFFWCWTPYVTMVVWYQIDLDGATKINGYLRNALFMFAGEPSKERLSLAQLSGHSV